MHYYLDGYNFLFRLTKFNKSLQEERSTLLNNLSEKANLLNLNLCIVFDAPYQSDACHMFTYQTLKVVFTDFGQTADEWLLNMVEKSSEKVTVVTSDLKLKRALKMNGAHTLNIAEFLQLLQKRLRKKKVCKKQFSRPLIPLPIQREENLPAQESNYLLIFEKRFQELEPQALDEQTQVPKPTSEFERWLHLFTEKIQGSDFQR